MGKLIREAGQEAELSASILRFYGDEGPAIAAPRALDTDAGDAVLVDEPFGPLVGVEPWNYPLYQVVARRPESGNRKLICAVPTDHPLDTFAG